MPSIEADDGQVDKASFAEDDQSDLVAFDLPPTRSGSDARLAREDDSDLVAFDLPPTRSVGGLEAVVSRNPVATAVAALAVGIIIGILLG
jgi:hypothetical protein